MLKFIRTVIFLYTGILVAGILFGIIGGPIGAMCGIILFLAIFIEKNN